MRLSIFEMKDQYYMRSEARASGVARVDHFPGHQVPGIQDSGKRDSTTTVIRIARTQPSFAREQPNIARTHNRALPGHNRALSGPVPG